MNKAPRNELEAYATLRAQARHARQHQRGHLYRLPAQKRHAEPFLRWLLIAIVLCSFLVMLK